MLINFFEKWRGLEYLQAVYSLSDKVISKIKELCYVHCEEESITEDIVDNVAAMFSWLSSTEKEALKKGIVFGTQSQWQVANFAVELFLSISNIKLDDLDLSDLHFKCIHVSSSIDNGEAIRKHGLRKLTDLLENQSPVSDFLAEYGISVKPSERRISIMGKKLFLAGTDLEVKLYSTNSEIEAFIAGEIETLKDYSCIESNPEFLRELSALCNTDLEAKWSERKNALLYVCFDVSFDEISNITEMACLNSPDNYSRILPYLHTKYEYGAEPIEIWRNYWFINTCLYNSCPDLRIDRSTMAVKKNIILSPERITIFFDTELQAVKGDNYED